MPIAVEGKTAIGEDAPDKEVFYEKNEDIDDNIDPKEEDTKEEDPKPEGKKKEAEDAAPEIETVKAEDLKFPEGATINEAIQKSFLGFVNEQKFTAKQTQGLIDLQQQLNVAQTEAQQAEKDGWEVEARSDKELTGANGTELEANLSIAKKGMESLKVEGLPKFLVDTGLGNHPILLKAFLTVGKRISPDVFHRGDGGGAEQEAKESKDIFYPSKK